MKRLLVALFLALAGQQPAFAAISDATPRAQYTSTGGTAYTFTFPIWLKSELKVYADDTLKTVDTHYTVTFTAGGSGGTVTFLSAPTAGTVVTIIRDRLQERTPNFPTSGAFSVSSLNTQLDKLAANVQDLQEKADRALTVPPQVTSAPWVLPAPVAGTVIGYDALGALANYTPTSAGAIPDLTGYTYTVGLADLITKGPWIDVRAYGAVGDGTTDDTAAIRAAIAAGLAANKPVRLSGMHKITSTLGPYDGDSGGNTGALIIEAPDAKSPLRYGLKYVPVGTGTPLLQVTVSTYPLRVYLRGIALLGDDTANDGIDLNGASWGASMEIDSCEIGHFGGKAVRIRAGIDTIIRNTKINYSGILISQEAGGLTTTTLRVLSSYLSSATGNGVELRHFYSAYFGDNTVFESIAGHAIYVNNTYAFQSSLQLDSPYFEAIDGSALYVEQTTNYLAHVGIRGMTLGDGAVTKPYIYLDHVWGADIEVNHWQQTVGSSILETSADVGKVRVRVGYTGAPTGTARANSTAYTAGSSRIAVTTTPYSVTQTRYFICTTSGTSDGSQPAAYDDPTNITVTDGTAVFRQVAVVTPKTDRQVVLTTDSVLSGVRLSNQEFEYEGVKWRWEANNFGARGQLALRSVLPDATTTTALIASPLTNLVNIPVGLQVGTGTTITKHLSGTATWDPASTADGAMTSTTVTITGAAVGDTVSVGFSVAVPAGALLTGAVTATNTVTVTLFNKTGAPLDLASGTLRADVWQH